MNPNAYKQETFCRAFLELGDATQAYRQAYSADRMKPDTVWRRTKELMNNGNVAARLGALGITAEAIKAERRVS
jgi:hypothetical protein